MLVITVDMNVRSFILEMPKSAARQNTSEPHHMQLEERLCLQGSSIDPALLRSSKVQRNGMAIKLVSARNQSGMLAAGDSTP